MLCSITYLELILALDTKAYDQQIDLVKGRSEKKGYKLFETDYGFTDETFLSEGIGVKYYGDSKRKKITISVRPCMLMGKNVVTDEIWKPSEKNITLLLEELELFVNSYFCTEYSLSDLQLSLVSAATDIVLDSQKQVADYIALLHNLGRIKLFSLIKYDDNGDKAGDNFFGLSGNTNGAEFRVYGMKHDRRVLRAETRLTTKNLIRAYAAANNTAKQIRNLARESDNVVMDTFGYIVPKGAHYKKKKADKLIKERVSDGRLRKKMLKLVELIPIKKSLHLAQKALNAWDIKDIMKEFGKINVSPVTISKRSDCKELKSLYDYLR